MTHYDYPKMGIGGSDIATLILVGWGEDGSLKLEPLYFGEDNYYHAYIVDDKCEVPDYYKKKYEFGWWLRIYDDEELVQTFCADRIEVYRSGKIGCIIRLINEKEDTEDE